MCMCLHQAPSVSFLEESISSLEIFRSQLFLCSHKLYSFASVTVQEPHCVGHLEMDFTLCGYAKHLQCPWTEDTF